MEPLSQYLKENILITDGAMGTYYASVAPQPLARSEYDNIYNKDIIKDIHSRYINAGAKLIRTNTFGANTLTLQCSPEKVREIILNGYNIALEAAKGKDIYIGASIGPIPYNGDTDYMDMYRNIADIWAETGVSVYVLETFSDTEYILKLSEYIKKKDPSAFILAEFSLNSYGMTKSGLSAAKAVETLCQCSFIDALGFNCGVGPMHMAKILDKLDYRSTKPFSALPNAGYPDIINEKISYVNNPDYFASIVSGFVNKGVKIIGGCCGTTPEHIEKLSLEIKKTEIKPYKAVKFYSDKGNAVSESKSGFFNKMKNTFVYAVELDPPFGTKTDKLIEGAMALKTAGADIITIADSPMGKSRADSVIISSKIKRKTGMEVLPHICCRDKNAIALRSLVLGAYIEGIRNFLAVTGDPVPGESKDSIKSVFNMNSFSLMSMLKQMKEETFEEAVHFGGAANFNIPNKDIEYNRLLKKQQCGCEFFLTQPVFTKDTIEYIKSIHSKRSFKLLGGIMPLVSYNNAMFINNELSGINIPEEYVLRFSPDMDRQTEEDVGIKIALEIAEELKPYVDGFYIMTPFNRYNLSQKIIEETKKL